MPKFFPLLSLSLVCDGDGLVKRPMKVARRHVSWYFVFFVVINIINSILDNHQAEYVYMEKQALKSNRKKNSN